MADGTSPSRSRINWVDYAKGICIILVVMMHSTLGVEKAAGEVSWLNGFIEWARPFRMPDFFLISGLFLASRINKPWREYIDSKVLHFAYFYVLWMNIQFLTKAPAAYVDAGMLGVLQSYFVGYIEPYGTLVVHLHSCDLLRCCAKLVRNVSPLIVFAALQPFLKWLPLKLAGCWWTNLPHALSTSTRATGSLRTSSSLPPKLRAAAPLSLQAGSSSGPGSMAWLSTQVFSHAPVLSLALGFIGACAVVSTGVLLAKFRAAEAIRYCGENSIVIYLAFFLFMVASRTLLLKTGIVADLGLVSLIVTASGVIGSIALFWVVRNTKLSFLFRRPKPFRLSPKAERWHTVAHEQQRPLETRRPSLSR